MAGVCNIALLGQKFMGRAHSNAYLKVAKFFNVPLAPVMHTIAGLDLIALAPFADRWGWKNYTTNWKEVVKNTDIHLVDVSTPNYMHAEQALAALANGKHVACEKPLAHTLKDARAMRNAAVKARRSKTFVWFNYRRCPAVALAHRLVQEGKLGRIYHVRASYLQDWGGPETPLVWRFQKKYAGSGAHGDLNAHIIDLARFITGQEIVEVTGAIAETFVTERPLPQKAGNRGGIASGGAARKQRGKSDVDDCVLFLARFRDGAVGTFEATRLATGNQNHNSIEVNGEHGSIRFGFEDMNLLWFYDANDSPALRGWRRIMCTTAGLHPYAGAWWPDAHIIGYEHTFVNMVADMLAVLGGEEPIVPLPSFTDAYETQRVLEAALLAAKHRAAVKLAEIK
ncbi:MAG: Gfo/Idh/MocA family oxidoreductase [Phycisphaerales bacterium]|nr:Gfo/Idh/MocA family oxidoreductase [Phycisphaerales bacterium]